MTLFKFLFTIFLYMSINSVLAQVYDLYQPETFKNNDGELPYRIMTPIESADLDQYPLVIFLHGSGEKGSNNRNQLKHVADHFAAAKIRVDHPAYVVFPQCPADSRWGSGEYSDQINRTGYKMAAQPSLPGKLVIDLIDELGSKLPIDPDRIYLAGLSMGGYGAFDLIARFPAKFAAAIPVCGAGDAEVLARQVNIPLWIAHGADDASVPVGTSRAVVEAMRKAGKTVVYTEFPGVEHDSWNPLFGENPLIYDWLFAQRKSD